MPTKPPRLLTIRLGQTDGAPEVPPVEYAFLEWKDDHRDKAYLVGPSGEALVLQLIRPSTAGILWSDSIIPPGVPVLIEPARLVPPPTRMSSQDAALLRDFRKIARAAMATDWDDELKAYYVEALKRVTGAFQIPERWETRHDDCLTPPDDREEMGELLERLNKAGAAEYEQRKIEESQWTRIEASDWLFAKNSGRQITDDEYQAFLKSRQQDLEKVFAWYPLTMSGLLKDAGGEVTKFLHARWARESGQDLRRMVKEKAAFLSHAQEIAILAEGSKRATTMTQLPWYPASLEDLAASVRFRVTMSDGQTAWLSGFTSDLPADSDARRAHAEALAAHPDAVTLTPEEAQEILTQQLGPKKPVRRGTWESACASLQLDPRARVPRSLLPMLRAAIQLRRDRPGNAKNAGKQNPMVSR